MTHLYPGAAWNVANAKEIRRALIAANFAATNSDSESFLRHVKMACLLATDYFRHPNLTPEQQAQVQAILRLNVKHPTPHQLGMLTSTLWSLAKNVIAGEAKSGPTAPPKASYREESQRTGRN